MGDGTRQPTQSGLRDRVARFVRAGELCRAGERVLVACSGGCDSTALLDILRMLVPQLDISVGAAYVDHRQRPDSAAPARLLRRRCRRWGLRFHVTALDGGDLSPGASEAHMRTARFAALRRLARSHGYQRVALGHTRDDQVETILMRILRGTGPPGLSGIPAQRMDFYFRPLLTCGRAELAAYLRARRLRWFEDPANHDRGFLRNRIRHEILPLLRQTANPSVDQALLRLSHAAARDNHLLDQMAGALQPAGVDDQESRIPLATLDNLHDAVRARLVVRMLATVAGPGSNLEQDHLGRILEHLHRHAEESWSLDLPGGWRAVCDGVVFRIGRIATQPVQGFTLPVRGPGTYTLPDGHTRVRLELRESFQAQRASDSHVFFDAREVPFPLLLRSVAPGDRIRPWGGAGERKVARLLMDAKVPRRQRPLVPLLVSRGHGVLWVAGLRRSSAAPVTGDTRPVLSARLLTTRPHPDV